MLLVQNLKKIDAGTQKNIYEHPSDSDKIIKGYDDYDAKKIICYNR